MIPPENRDDRLGGHLWWTWQLEERLLVAWTGGLLQSQALWTLWQVESPGFQFFSQAQSDGLLVGHRICFLLRPQLRLPAIFLGSRWWGAALTRTFGLAPRLSQGTSVLCFCTGAGSWCIQITYKSSWRWIRDKQQVFGLLLTHFDNNIPRVWFLESGGGSGGFSPEIRQGLDAASEVKSDQRSGPSASVTRPVQGMMVSWSTSLVAAVARQSINFPCPFKLV